MAKPTNIRIEVPIVGSLVYNLDVNQLQEMLSFLEEEGETLNTESIQDYLGIYSEVEPLTQFDSYDNSSDIGIFAEFPKESGGSRNYSPETLPLLLKAMNRLQD